MFILLMIAELIYCPGARVLYNQSSDCLPQNNCYSQYYMTYCVDQNSGAPQPPTGLTVIGIPK